jgi:Protein of unknown function (DUF751)
MNFLENLLRYPRFFISSMLGLSLIVFAPITRLSQEVKNKTLFFFVLLVCIFFLLEIINQMIDPTL